MPKTRQHIDFRCYLIADRHKTGGRPLIAALQAAANAGIKICQLREKDLTPREIYALAIEARQVLDPLGTRLLINDRTDIACAAGAAGVHLTTTSLTPANAAKCLPENSLIAVSTHTLVEARFAEESGADFITFGPVFETPSKAQFGPPRGLQELREICAAVKIPVFALGGITPQRVAACREAGAHGIAAISALLDVPSIPEAVAEFAQALGEL